MVVIQRESVDPVKSALPPDSIWVNGAPRTAPLFPV
jgi:hypothetical protein